MNGKLTNQNHNEMDSFLEEVFDEIRHGNIDKEHFVGGMAHVIAAVDKGNVGEAISWFKNGSKNFTLDSSNLSGSDKLS